MEREIYLQALSQYLFESETERERERERERQRERQTARERERGGSDDYQKGTTIADGEEHMREPAATSSKNDGGTERGEDKGWTCCLVLVTKALVVG